MPIQNSLSSILTSSDSMRRKQGKLSGDYGIIGNSKMEDRRKDKRFPIELSSRYLKENEEEWKGCTVTNISRCGMSIIVYVQERIPKNSSLQFEIIVPTKEKPIKVIGILRWINKQKGEMNFVGGIEFTKIDFEDKWTLMDYAYDS